MTRHIPPRSFRRRIGRQRGVVLLFSLIALVIMLIAAVALLRSFHGSLFSAGNIAFKRDMQNQSERAVGQVLTEFRSGGLTTSLARANSDPTRNYSATMLPTDAQGIPDALQLSDIAFDRAYTAPPVKSTDQSVTVRYLVDRLCTATGDEATLGADTCMLSDNAAPSGTSSSNLQGADRGPLRPGARSAVPQAVVYRLSIKVTGPRNTQSFFQSTFNVPS